MKSKTRQLLTKSLYIENKKPFNKIDEETSNKTTLSRTNSYRGSLKAKTSGVNTSKANLNAKPKPKISDAKVDSRQMIIPESLLKQQMRIERHNSQLLNNNDNFMMNASLSSLNNSSLNSLVDYNDQISV